MADQAPRRDRKVRVTLHAMYLAFSGLVACLLTAVLVRDSIGLLVGLYTPFGLAVGGALQIFVSGNVRVHQAQAGGEKP